MDSLNYLRDGLRNSMVIPLSNLILIITKEVVGPTKKALKSAPLITIQFSLFSMGHTDVAKTL